MKINKQQLAAIRHNDGPLLIVAGAGTGKTTVITERIKSLIVDQGVKPQEILALTFTDKASREMEERVDVAMPYGYSQTWIMTFHSFCDRILRAEALNVGLDPKFKLMSTSANIQFIRDNLFEVGLKYFLPLGNPTKFVHGLMQHFSRLQDEDISPLDYVEWVKSKFKKTNTKEEELEKEKYKELSNAFKIYNELKIRDGVMDYGDLITKTLSLFRLRPNILKNYRETFKHILVDEFQDTNYAQYELVKLLAPSEANPNLIVVGDDSQSIYKFRGAAISNILQFRDDYKNCQMIVLTENYRSTQTILDAAYKLIQHNNPDTLESRLQISKNLKSNIKGNFPVTFIHETRVENEAECVAGEIQKLISEGLEPKDFAILVRANAHAEPFVRALERVGVSSQFLGPGKLFREPEVVELLSYLKVLYDFTDSSSFYKLISQDYFEIDTRDIIRLLNYARKFNLSLFEASEYLCGENIDVPQSYVVSPDTKEKVNKILAIVNEHLKIINKTTAGAILYDYLDKAGIRVSIFNIEGENAEKRAANISKFFEKLKSYEVEHEDASVRAVVEWIALASELGESPLSADFDWSANNAVNIMTVHGAKGLEFPVVFLVNLVSQRFPSMERREQIPLPDTIIKEELPTGDYHIQEERRLFYVGMTRAKNRLYLSAADFYGEGKRSKKLSPFIFEAMGGDAVAVDRKQNIVDSKNPSEKLPSTTYNLPSTKIDFLSFSQIESFKICPLHYKLCYLLKIPTPTTPSLSFGNSIHATLKEFYEQARETKVKKSDLLKIFENSWSKEGYMNKRHEEEMYKKGKDTLSSYFDKEFDPGVKTIALEDSFELDLDISPKLSIGGRIDRVDDIGGSKIEIIDYKTGSTVPSQREVDRNLQLTFYALAASKLKEKPYARGVEDIKLSLYYFENQSKVTTTRTKAQLVTAVKEIEKMRERIEESDFKCSGHMFCENCEYVDFCKSDTE